MQCYLRVSMMSLCFSGCSITWGDELEKRYAERYSTLVSNHYDARHTNISKCGISNDNIVRNTIKHIQNTNTNNKNMLPAAPSNQLRNPSKHVRNMCSS